MSYTSLKTEMCYAVERAEESIDTATSRTEPTSTSLYGDYNLELLGDIVRLEDGIKQIERIQDKISHFLPTCTTPEQLAKLDLLATGTTAGGKSVKGYLTSLRDARNLLVETQIKQKKILSKIATSQNPSSTSSPATTTTNTVIHSDTLMLPKLNYERFDGNKKKFDYFWTRFGTIDKHPNLSGAQKLNYLIGLLDGEAKAALLQYEPSDRNYPLAVDTLKNKFGKVSDIVKVLNDEFLALHFIDNSITSVRQVYDSAEIILRQMESHGQDVEHQTLRCYWMQIMPGWLKEPCFLEKGLECSLTDIRKHAEKTLSVKEQLYKTDVASTKVHLSTKPTFNNNKKQRNGDRATGKKQPDEKSNFRKADFKRDKQQKECFLCERAGHGPSSCTKYPTVAARRTKCKELSCCLKCCSTRHKTEDCTGLKNECQACHKQGHSVVFCEDKVSKMKAKATPKTTVAVVETSEIATVTTASTKTSTDVVLPVTKADIASTEDRQFNQTPTLLDSGSMLSYITIAHAKSLQLQPLSFQELNVETFMNSDVQRIKAPIFEIIVKCTNDDVDFTSNIRTVQIQSGASYMVVQPNSTSLQIQVPLALLTATRDFQLTYWNTNEGFNSSTVTCEPIDYCMYIKPCWICLEELSNPECRPFKIILMFSNLLSILYIFLHKLFKVWRRYRTRKSGDYGIELNIFKRKKSDESVLVRFRKLSAAVRRNSRESIFKMAIVVSIILLTSISIAAAEDESDAIDSISINAQRQQCVINSNGWANCKITEVTQFTTSSSQPSHLLINFKDRPMGSITVTPEVYLECIKLTRHFTRIGNVQTSSVKICGGKNLCSGIECAQATSQMTVPALGKANELPGNTYCHESCGGWTCKCWTWGEACIYYRNYIFPSDPRILEVFTCSSWRTKLILNTTITTQDDTSSRLLIMNEGHSIEYNKLKVSALDLNPQTTPPTADYHFITTGKTTAMLADSGLAAANILQCPDKTSAENLNCTLREECHCVPADGIAACSCLHNQALLKQINENGLPLVANDMIFEATSSGSVIARIHARPRLQLEMKDMHLFTAIDSNSCTAKVHTLEGCTSCKEGAVLQLTCSTNFGSAAAHVTCPDMEMSFPVSCSKDGYFQKISLFFNQVIVDTVCQLRCPSNVFELKLAATLKKNTLANSWSKVAVDVHAEPSLVLELLKAGKELVETNYHYLIIVLVVTAFVSLILLYLFKRFI